MMWYLGIPDATKVCIKVLRSETKKNQRSVDARKR